MCFKIEITIKRDRRPVAEWKYTARGGAGGDFS